MKKNMEVASSRRRQRKAHFQAPSNERRIVMSSRLSKPLREKFRVRSVPIRKDDEVKILAGRKKGTEGKVKAVYRKRYCILIDRVTRNKANQTPVEIPIHPSNVEITKLHLDKDRKKLLNKKAKPVMAGDKASKIQQDEVSKTSTTK
jgi:large subunit ribosomal protein L26e